MQNIAECSRIIFFNVCTMAAAKIKAQLPGFFSSQITCPSNFLKHIQGFRKIVSDGFEHTY